MVQPSDTIYTNFVSSVTAQSLILQPRELCYNPVTYTPASWSSVTAHGLILQPQDDLNELRPPPRATPRRRRRAALCVHVYVGCVFREFCYYCTIAISTTSQDVDVYRLVCSRYLHAASVVVNGTGVFTPSEHYVDSESG